MSEELPEATDPCPETPEVDHVLTWYLDGDIHTIRGHLYNFCTRSGLRKNEPCVVQGSNEFSVHLLCDGEEYGFSGADPSTFPADYTECQLVCLR